MKHISASTLQSMDKRTLNSLLRIIDYVMPEEEKHWDEAERPRKHVYHDLMRVRSWALHTVIERGIARI